MTDEELVAAFESTELPGDQFGHTEHVHVAWWYLQRSSLPDALLRFSTALQRFAAAQGAVGKYHETMTVAWMLIIADRLSNAQALSWAQFAAANPDLFDRPSPVDLLYRPETLASDRARNRFVLPDRLAPGPDPGDLPIRTSPIYPKANHFAPANSARHPRAVTSSGSQLASRLGPGKIE